MELQLFALRNTREFGKRISKHLQIHLALLEERNFEDGEHKTRPLENVRGRDVFVVQSLYSDHEESVNDKLCRLLFFIGALKDASAEKVTAVIPYFGYARKDRKTKSRDPITMKYVAKLLETAGTDHVITMDIHNISAFQNAFRIPTEHLEARVLLAPFFARMNDVKELVVVSPDTGGMKRAEKFRETLMNLSHQEISTACLDKQRSEGIVEGADVVIGEVKGKATIIVDDIISSGKTIKLAVDALDRAGAARIFVCASHGIFVGDANMVLAHPRLEKLFITDSIPPFRATEELLREKIEVLDSSILFARAMKRVQSGESLVELLESYPHSAQEAILPT